MFWFKSKRQKAIEAIHRNARLVAKEFGNTEGHWGTHEFRTEKIQVRWIPDKALGPSTGISLCINDQWVNVFDGYEGSIYRYKPGRWEDHLEALAGKADTARTRRKRQERNDRFGPVDDSELFGQDFLHLVETEPNPGSTR